ncbi:hypothetical protein [Rhodococcoides fascians]|uniref:hypothetical protein n=1 Tax=Rhodococcoides fascians TaxID=1828 RepID=UPI00055CA4BA|nr:hypothetical protein [Rhodococcus fascians]
MSKELEIIADAMRDVATEGHNGAPGARDDGQLWGAFPNTMTVHDLAAHVVSRLSDAGYSIVELPAYSEQVADTRPGFEGLTFPVWYPQGLADIGAAVGQHPGIVEARWSGLTMWTPDEARAVAAALLSAAAAAEEDQ